MKKFLSVLLVALLALTMSVSAFADDSQVPREESKDVEIVINSSSIDDTSVYSVNVAWDSLTFTYTISDGAWDPETHSYPGGWDKTDANITVTNHSNAGVNVSAAFTEGGTTATKSSVTARLGNATFTLGTAVGTAVGEAPSDTITVAITGAPDVTDGYTLSTITVTISVAD